VTGPRRSQVPPARPDLDLLDQLPVISDLMADLPAPCQPRASTPA